MRIGRRLLAVLGALVLASCAGVPALGAQTPGNNVSPGAAEVIRLAQAGVSDEVILAYVQNSPAMFSLSADNILYLKDLGLSSQIIAGMLNRDSTLQSQPQPATPPPAAPAPFSEPATPPDAGPPPDYVGDPPEDVNYFYSDLSPYGAWVDLDGVGWCWQPSVVVINHGWRPYCDGGHWANTDDGWFWQSDYSWGWAAFHYGRWYEHPGHGWVWTPDRTWGPAWVAWRTGGDHCGWAPLPPHADFDAHYGWRFNGVSVGANFDFGLRPEHFTFVAMKDFTARDLGHRRMEPTEVTKIYNQTTIINNYAVSKNTVVNRGIPVARITAATGKPVPKVTVRDLPAGSAGDKSGSGALVAYRRPLKAPAAPVNVVAQRVDAQHPVIQHHAVLPVGNQRRITPSPVRPGTTPAEVPRRPQNPVPNAPQRPTAEKASANQPGASKPAAYTPPPQLRAEAQPPAESKSPPRTAYSPPAQTVPQSPVRPQSQQIYYPKTYHQAAEVHSLPPASQRQAAPAPQREAPSAPHPAANAAPFSRKN